MSVLTTYVCHPSDDATTRLNRYVDVAPIAAVTLANGHLTVQSDDPMVLLRISKAFEKAATQLADECLERADLEARGA